MPTPFVLSSDLVSAYPAKSVEIADYIDGYKLDTGPVQNAQTGTTYTFALSDTTKTVTANNAAASAYTVPPQSAVVWENYTTLRILNLGAGIVTLTAGAGVTLTGIVTLAQYSSATLTRTGSNAWTISGNPAAVGMVLITPTSVAGTGVTLSGGQVTFSASSTVSVNGCFSATYDNYLISVRNSWADASGTPYLDLRLRLSGTDSAVNYSYVLAQAFTTITVDTSANNTTLARIARCGDINNALGASNINIFAPFLAQRTTLISDSSLPYSNTSMKRNMSSGDHSPATSYDGFTLLPSASTLTGTLRIYGLRSA